jgi:hypothetical protein
MNLPRLPSNGITALQCRLSAVSHRAIGGEPSSNYSTVQHGREVPYDPMGPLLVPETPGHHHRVWLGRPTSWQLIAVIRVFAGEKIIIAPPLIQSKALRLRNPVPVHRLPLSRPLRTCRSQEKGFFLSCSLSLSLPLPFCLDDIPPPRPPSIVAPGVTIARNNPPVLPKILGPIYL